MCAALFDTGRARVLMRERARIYGHVSAGLQLQLDHAEDLLPVWEAATLREPIIRVRVSEARWRQERDGKPFTGMRLAWLREPKPLAPGCETAEPADIPAQVESLLHFIRTSKLPAQIVAAHVPYAIGRVHPFVDGNGHVGRLLMCYLMAQTGVSVHTLVAYPDIHKARRDELHELFRASALGKTDSSEHVAFQLELVLEAQQIARIQGDGSAGYKGTVLLYHLVAYHK